MKKKCSSQKKRTFSSAGLADFNVNQISITALLNKFKINILSGNKKITFGYLEYPKLNIVEEEKGFNKITLEKEKALENTNLVNIYALR